jgi:hypothetical protein
MPGFRNHRLGESFAQLPSDQLPVGVGQLMPQGPCRVSRRAAVAGEMRQASPICSAIPRPILSGCTCAASRSATWDLANRTDSATCNAAVTDRSFSSRPIRSIRSASTTGVQSATVAASSAST